MRTRINVIMVILWLLFLPGCGRKENEAQNEADVSVAIENGDEVSTETKSRESVSEEAEGQYPLIATPSSVQWIDLVLVSDGAYCIFGDNKYGFMRENGEEIAPFIYDIAYPFSEGLACVYKEGKYGYIDLEGETAIPFAYDRATPFAEGLAYFAAGDSYGFMDKTGEPVFYFECDSVSSFQEGLAYFCKDGYYGYIDQKGQVAIEPVFDDAGYFKEGLAKVMKEGRYGVIDRDGVLVVVAEYDSIDIDDTFIIARSEGKYACFDREGKVLLEEDNIDDVYVMTGGKGKYIRFEKADKQGLIDEKGNILIEPVYDWISSLIPEHNLALIWDKELYGVVDFQGEVKIPAIYDSIYYDRYVESAEGGMLILTDADGNRESVDVTDFSEKIPCNYNSIDWIDEDRAVVSLNGLSGIIDREGNEIEPIAYDMIRVFADDGSVWMKKGEKTWLYNSRGKAVDVNGRFDNIILKENCYLTEKDGRYGFLNEEGEEVVSPVFDSVDDYKVYGSDKVYVSNYTIIKTGESERTDISEVLLHNEITPRIGLYQEFIRNGRISVDDAASDHNGGQENLKEYKKIYKLYDLDHSGESVLFFYAAPYGQSYFQISYSGFYAIQNNQLAELVTGYECGGSLRGDYACLWYDRETSRVLLGTDGLWGGFGGYDSLGVAFDRKDGEMTQAVSFEYIAQSIMDYSEEELEHAELLYDWEDKPYTKERLAEAENESALKYSVNGIQTTIEEYQEIRDRYQILHYVE